MIIFINGAFGVGKTTTATLLEAKLPNAMIFDPEYVGIMLREMIPKEKQLSHERTVDFQDFDLWKVLTVETMKAFKQQYKRDLIVPMTIREKTYFDYIYEGVHAFDNEVYHFCLSAPKVLIHERLEQRGDLPGSWAFHQTEKCMDGFETIENMIEINNAHLAPEKVVDLMLETIEKSRKGLA